MLSNIKYKLRAFFGMSFKRMFKSIDECHKRSGKSKIYLFFDMIYCQFRFGSGHNDYRLFAFYDMTNKQRDTYLTRVRNHKIIEALNPQRDSDLFDNKAIFNERFKKYLNRETIDAEKVSISEFNKFVKKHKTVFCKPYKGDSGRGIEKLNLKDFKNEKEMYDYIIDKKIGVVEEVITQHKDMSKVNPHCVNCMRLVTVVNKDKVDVIYGVVKFGTTTDFVDNMGFGAVSCPIDMKTGKIKYDGQTEHEEVISVHPVSKIKFVGYQIPMFNDAVKMVKEAAMEIPHMRQIGWDICITKNGPAIIEGNDWTDYMFWQLPAHTPDKTGLMPYYRKILPELKL